MKILLIVSILFKSIVSLATLTETTLVLNWKAEPEFGGFYESLSKGYFEKSGLKVKIQEGGSGTPTLQMLVNKQIDYAIVSAEEIMLHNFKDPQRKIIAVFTVFDKAPYMLMAHSDQNYKNLSDVFKDKDAVVSVQKGLPYVDFLIKKHGPVQAKIVPYQGGIGLFEKNKKLTQQGFITSEFLLAQEKNLKPQSWLVADEGFNPYIGIVAVREDFLKSNEAQVKSMVKAIRQGWESYIKSPAQTNEQLMKLNPSLTAAAMSKSLVKMKELMNFGSEPFGTMKLERWKSLQNQMTELNLISPKSETQTQVDKFYQNF